MDTTNFDANGELQWFHESCLDLGRERTLDGVLNVLLDRVLSVTSARAGIVRIEQDTLAACAAEQYGEAGAGEAGSGEAGATVAGAAVAQQEAHDKGIVTPGGAVGRDNTLVVQRGATVQRDTGDDLTIPLHLAGCTLGILHIHDFATTPAERALVLIELLCEQAAQVLPGVQRQERVQQNINQESILAALDEPVYLRDHEGRVSEANKAFCDLFRIPSENVAGAVADELREALPRYQHLNEQDEAGKHVVEFACDKPERLFQETRLPLENGWQVCRIREVTEQRRLYAQLLHIEKPAALGELIGGVTHELNNPLATVIGYAQLLETEDNLPPRVQRGLHHIHLEAQRASQIVTSLRAFAGRTVSEKSRLDINEMLRVLGQMKFSQFSEEDIQYSEEFDESLPPVWGDAPQLQQAFLKIVNNAQQAFRETESLSTERSKKLHVVTRRLPGKEDGKQRVRIEFIDNGPGIAAGYIDRVFEPFFTTRPLGRGAGLGLTIASRVVSEHGGEIHVESEHGQGARFIIELPGVGTPGVDNREIENREVKDEIDALSEFVARQEMRIAATNAKSGAAKETAFSSSLLIVGNTPAGVTPIAAALSGVYQVTVCYGGVEATALLAGGEFDLIVVMVEAPRDSNDAASGEPSFIEYLQTIPPDLLPKLLFIANGTLPPAARDFLNGTEAHVLTVPIEPETLRETVWQLLEEAP